MLKRVFAQLTLVLFVLPSFVVAQQNEKTIGEVDGGLNVCAEASHEEVDQTWGFGTELPLGTSLNESVNYAISRAKRRAEKGKISEFDGIILNPSDGSSYRLIKFKPDSL